MVTVFTLSEHGAIKRRPRVLLQFMADPPPNYDLYKFSYSVRDGAALNNVSQVSFEWSCYKVMFFFLLQAEPGDTIATTKEGS